MKTYLSYGSNMHVGQMNHRCQDAKIHAAGFLYGYRLDFRRGGFATINPGKPTDRVPVLIWDITPRDEQALDRYEGYPKFYIKETVTAETDHGPVEAMVYIMAPEFDEQEPPTEWYLQTIIHGYRDAGLQGQIPNLKKTAMQIYKETRRVR